MSPAADNLAVSYEPLVELPDQPYVGANLVGGAKLARPLAQAEWIEVHSRLGPTILDNVAPDSAAATQELLGPVLSVVRVASLSQALESEAKSPYGNATSVFTQSGVLGRQVADRAQSGMIGVDVGVPVLREPFSFGGTKASCFGHVWTKLKKVTAKWGHRDGSWMS